MYSGALTDAAPAATLCPVDLPAGPPFVLRARVLTPLAAGGTRYEHDGVVAVDESGRITAVAPYERWATEGDEAPSGIPAPPDVAPLPAPRIIDLRPWLLMPGLVDLHVHLPQVPAAGLGAGLDLLTWLDRYIFPLERTFDRATAEKLMPGILRAMARAGTTTMLAYGAIWPDSLDAAFRAAEEHGIRAVIGKVMMDELTYDERIPRGRILDVSLEQSVELCERWNGADDGRLRYAFTPRFAVSCSAEMLRESASLARHYGAYWQTHLSEDRGEIAEVGRRFPEARDYLDVYDRAGALGERTILGHAVHLSDREMQRLVESGSRIAHCPASNLFLASGVMPLARYLEAGAVVGLGSDVAGGPDLSMVTQMRVGAYVQNALRTVGDDRRAILDPLSWLRLGTLEGARALGMYETIGSLEEGKEADLIAVDPARTAPLPGIDSDDPAEIASRLIFRGHPEMVQAAWVRGRLLSR